LQPAADARADRDLRDAGSRDHALEGLRPRPGGRRIGQPGQRLRALGSASLHATRDGAPLPPRRTPLRRRRFRAALGSPGLRPSVRAGARHRPERPAGPAGGAGRGAPPPRSDVMEVGTAIRAEARATDYDPLRPEVRADPYPYYAALR